MGSITIRNLSNDVKESARIMAARNGRSLEAEIRALLEQTYQPPESEHAARIRAMSGEKFVAHLIAVAKGATFELPERTVSEDRDAFGAD